MNQKGSVAVWLLLIALLGLGGTLGYTLLMQQAAKSDAVLLPQDDSDIFKTPPVQKTMPTAKTPPSVQQNTETNWKTYTNTQYGFSFNYPSNTVVKFVDHVPPHGTDLVLPDDGANPDKTTGNFIEKDGSVGDALGFMVFQKSTKNLGTYVTNYYCGWPESAGMCKTVQINGQTAYQVRFDNGITRVHMQNSSHAFVFDYSADKASDAQTMLSTLSVFDILSEMPIENVPAPTKKEIFDPNGHSMSILVPNQFTEVTKLWVADGNAPPSPPPYSTATPFTAGSDTWYYFGDGDAGCSNEFYYRVTTLGGVAVTVTVSFHRCEGYGHAWPTADEVREILTSLARG